jgi:pimeloyl-ACP methyl ester carboxylesterase
MREVCRNLIRIRSGAAVFRYAQKPGTHTESLMNRRRFLWTTGAAGAAIVSSGVVGTMYRRDLDRAVARVGSGSTVINLSQGLMEYAEAGLGPPVLMIHGTGGGFDQGLDFTRGIAAAGWRIIAPSRFGYLRSDFPNDASSEAQADAFASLLDHLGIARLPVMGGSAGALSAIQFAIRYPDRCSALVALVPATHVPGRAPVRPSATGAAIMRYGLQSDFLFWTGVRLAEGRMIGTLLATDPALVAAAAPEEQARVRRILNNILPISLRSRGLLNDGALAGTPAPADLSRIRAPTLALSLEDDRFGTWEAAQHIAQSVAGAQLKGFKKGGHVWVGHDAEVTAIVTGFLRDSF